MIRCDRTAAWTALQGHFETHGSRFDLREAFARDAGRFDALGFEQLALTLEVGDLFVEFDLDVRRDADVFHFPFSVETEDRPVRGRHRAAVEQRRIAADADEATVNAAVQAAKNFAEALIGRRTIIEIKPAGHRQAGPCSRGAGDDKGRKAGAAGGFFKGLKEGCANSPLSKRR